MCIDFYEVFFRICRFKNICYYPKKDRFLFLKNRESILDQIPLNVDEPFLEKAGIGNHNVFYFEFDEVGKDFFKNSSHKVNFINELTFLFSRFHLGNIMHTFHDELIGLYLMIRKYAQPGIASNQPSAIDDLNLDHHIQFVDWGQLGDHMNLFQHFSNFPLRARKDLEKDESFTCFRDVVVGMSKLGTWYQYGFGMPQGPLNKTVNGNHIRQFSNYLLAKFGHKSVKPVARPHRVVLFSRSRNRLLSNQDELVQMLEKKFNLKVDVLSMENTTLIQMAEVLQETKLAIGLHGSILIMSLFLPPGSVLIELFPYAIPSENYTPYRRLAQLPGMNIIYRAWEVSSYQGTLPTHPFF